MNERPYRRILKFYVMLASAVYVCALIMTVAVVFKNMDYNREAKHEQLVHSTHLFREHVDRIFGNVNWIIETARNTYVENPDDREKLEKTLVALGKREEFAFFATMVGTDGISIASSLRTSGIDLRDREHIKALLAPNAPSIYITEPRVGARSSRLAINISKKIFDDEGVWRGIVVVSFDPSRIGKFLRSLSIDESGVAMLIRNDGVILARSTTTTGFDGSKFDSTEGLEALSRGSSGNFSVASPIDGVQRLFAFQTLTRLPLTVVVGIDYGYFDRERTEWLLLAALWMGLLGAALVGIGFLIRKFVFAEERRQAEQLAEAERLHTAELIQSSFNSTGVFVVVFDRQSFVRFANAPARELLDNVATPFDELLRQIEVGERTNDGQFAPTTTHWTRMRDETMRTICWSVAGAEWAGPDCRVAIGFDRTEAEHMERMLNQKARLAALGEVAVGIAHEVAQPLTIINFTCRRMEREPDRAEVQREGLATIKSAATRAGRILGQIKTFSKQYDQAGGAIFDVGECIETVELLMRRQLEDRRIALRLSGPGRPVFARGDPHLIEQIVLNLILNARDAILESRPAGDSWISLAWSAQGGKIAIRVRDNGPGIPAHLQSRVFEPFYTTKKGGTGLGLSLSFSMAQQMGGSLSLEKSAQGAVFVIELAEASGQAADTSGATDDAAVAAGA